jgi:peptidoglycan/xylan/chitin deacetylase (PgdA/CDA1 family)
MSLGLRRILGASLVTESQGEYGVRVGIGRILDLLQKYDIKATFFVPGLNAERYPAIIREIANMGHEVGHHGYFHESPLYFTSNVKKERALLQRGIEALEQTTGEKPKGYRAPGFDLTPQTLDLLLEHGFVYDSSLMADEKPYRVKLKGEELSLIEIPVDWVLDDFPHFAFWKPPVYMRGLSDPAHVFQIWVKEFEGYYESGGCFTLTMHPSIIGRYHRIQMLEALINHIKKQPDVWFARCIDVANYFQERFNQPGLRIKL